MTTSAADEILRDLGLDDTAAPVLPDDFWCTPQLRHVRLAAHSLGLPAAPVMLFTDAYVAAGTSYRVQLPGRPNYGSLNTTVVAVSESGGNKGSCARAAGLIAPLPEDQPCDCGGHIGPEEGDFITLPIGSGQGLVKSFMSGFAEGSGKQKRTVFRQDRRHVLIDIDEGTTLEVASSTSSADPMPVLASMWSGARAGWNNATSDRRLLLRPESYRVAVIAGLQSHRAGPIFEAGAIGVAQRTLWTPTSGRDVPDLDAEDLPDWPGPLQLDPAVLRPPGDEPVTVDVDPAVRRQVSLAHNRRTRGVDQVDPLDTHRDFNRLRVAARLALMHGEYMVSADRWELAGMVMDLSDATRFQVQQTLAARGQQANAARGISEAQRRLAHDEHLAQRVDKAAAALWRGVRRHSQAGVSDDVVNRKHPAGEPCTSRCVAWALRSWRAQNRDEVLARAEQLEWVVQHGDGWLPGPSMPTEEQQP